MRLDRKKIFATVLLRALGWETDEEILRLFTGKTELVPISRSLVGRVLVSPVVDRETDEILYQAGSELTATDVKELQQAGIQSVDVLTAEDAEATRFLRNAIEKDRQSIPYTKGHIKEQAMVGIFREIQLGDLPTLERAKSRFEKLFLDPLRCDLVNSKPLLASLKDFFGSSELSQFLQQANPLDELAHKRRLSALGPGGFPPELTTSEKRNIHLTHYGRICPLKTAQGQSVGLIVSPVIFTCSNNLGFLETPYRKVVEGKVSDEIVHLSAARAMGIPLPPLIAGLMKLIAYGLTTIVRH